MYAFFLALFEAILARGFSRVLIGAGLGFGTSAFLITFVNYYINKAVTTMSGTSADVLGLVALSGSDKGLSIIIGALVCRVTIQSLSLKMVKS